MKNRRITPSARRRFIGRWAAMAIALFLAVSLPYWPSSWPAVPLAAFSPFVAIGSVLAPRAVSALVLLAVPLLGLALVWRRWFCRHACPLGLLLEQVAKMRQPGPRGWRHCPPIGRWLAVMTVAGALAGYPMFLWLDPLAIFSGFFSAWRLPMTFATAVGGLALPVVLLMECWQPRFWCARICPLGGMQELLARGRGTKKASVSDRDRSDGRRGFIAAGLGLAGGLMARTVRAETPPLRPPGALSDDQFTGACIRCGNCTRVCPTKILQPDLGEHGLAGLLTPVMTFQNGYCQADCNRCTQVCPSGAIARLSLEEKRSHIIGSATINLGTCLLADGQECTACIRACPFEALTVFSDGFDSRPELSLTKCNGCGACETVCPVRPQRAIRVIAGRSEATRPKVA